VSDTRRSFLAWYGAELEEERELFGDNMWSYTIDDNRHVLETMARYAEMVGVTERRLEVDEMFVEES
jgi:4,5-dihydroxyphthalate decarboxylase